MDEYYDDCCVSDDWGQDDYNVWEEEQVFQDECAERRDAYCDDCNTCPQRDDCIDADPDPPEDIYLDQMFE